MKDAAVDGCGGARLVFGVFGYEEANPDARFPKREAGVAEGPGWALDAAAKVDNTANQEKK